MKFRALVAVTALALTLTACGGDKKESKADPKASERDSAKLVERSPLTGLPLKNGLPDNPAFVVKVENTANGAPQYALDRADMVFEELVEGGLTRLAAVYYSDLPKKVGHVRSMRATDIGIAAPANGQIVASGGAGGTYKRVKKAGLKVHSEDKDAAGFSSDTAKSRPYNRLINLRTLAKKSKSKPITGNYLPWLSAPAKPAAATPKTATKLDVRFSRSTNTTWKLDGNKWKRTNGHAASGEDFTADTVLIMYARVDDAGYTDPAGNPVPETVFEGKGDALLVNGKNVTEATWGKKGLEGEVTLTGKDGKPVGVNPGKVWVELVPKGDGKVTLN